MNRKFQEMEDQSVRISSRRVVKESSFEERYSKCERRLFNNVENGISNTEAALKKSRHLKKATTTNIHTLST